MGALKIRKNGQDVVLGVFSIELGTGHQQAARGDHTHDAGDTISGVFDAARLPASANVNVNVISATSIAALTTQQQGDIGMGTLVATSGDGKRWRYVSGSKTAEASYLLISDITPTLQDIFDASAPGRAVASAASYAAIRQLLGLDIFDIGAHYAGKLADNATILGLAVRQPFRLPAALTGTSIVSRIVGQSDSVIKLRKNDAEIGTITFAGGTGGATVNFPNDVDFALNNWFDVVGPATADATFGSVYITFAARML